uniref:Uncharacterized protein TCIL3000_8_720 n=1 Tax=Trypanosoma congolense (strain IL3000) TaxID=1068625 RepID=G0UR52_TRYCI|nr:unnamed protein product [Trypanosoma congolense IL3000]
MGEDSAPGGIVIQQTAGCFSLSSYAYALGLQFAAQNSLVSIAIGSAAFAGFVTYIYSGSPRWKGAPGLFGHANQNAPHHVCHEPLAIPNEKSGCSFTKTPWGTGGNIDLSPCSEGAMFVAMVGPATSAPVNGAESKPWASVEQLGFASFSSLQYSPVGACASPCHGEYVNGGLQTCGKNEVKRQRPPFEAHNVRFLSSRTAPKSGAFFSLAVDTLWRYLRNITGISSYSADSISNNSSFSQVSSRKSCIAPSSVEEVFAVGGKDQPALLQSSNDEEVAAVDIPSALILCAGATVEMKSTEVVHSTQCLPQGAQTEKAAIVTPRTTVTDLSGADGAVPSYDTFSACGDEDEERSHLSHTTAAGSGPPMDISYDGCENKTALVAAIHPLTELPSAVREDQVCNAGSLCELVGPECPMTNQSSRTDSQRQGGEVSTGEDCDLWSRMGSSHGSCADKRGSSFFVTPAGTTRPSQNISLHHGGSTPVDGVFATENSGLGVRSRRLSAFTDASAQLGDVELGTFLCSGRWGKVYKGISSGTGEVIAVKRLTFDSNDPELRQRLKELKVELEVLKMASQHHMPWIVGFRGAKKIDNSVLLCLEYCEGGSLLDYLMRSVETQSVLCQHDGELRIESSTMPLPHHCANDTPCGSFFVEETDAAFVGGVFERDPSPLPLESLSSCPSCSEKGSASFSLSSILALPIMDIQRFMRQTVEALGFLHSHGYAHSDVKTANILVAADGSARLADFGCCMRLKQSVYPSCCCAKQTCAALNAPYPSDILHGAPRNAAAAIDSPTGNTFYTSAGTGSTVPYAVLTEEEEGVVAELRGTALYIAPEIIRFERGRIGSAGDVWAMGCVAMELATGAAPWRHIAKDRLGVLLLVASAVELPLPPRIVKAAQRARVWLAGDSGSDECVEGDGEFLSCNEEKEGGDRVCGAAQAASYCEWDGISLCERCKVERRQCMQLLVWLEDFLRLCLRSRPEERPSCEEMLQHPFLATSWSQP